MIDLIEMKAIYYRDDLGNRIESSRSRPRCRAEAEKHRACDGRGCGRDGRRTDPQVPRGRGAHRRGDRHGLRLGTLQNQDRAGPDRLGPEEQGRAADAGRGRGLPALAAGRAADHRPGPEDGTEVVRTADDSEPFSALAFKIAADPFVGKLAFFRVYSGKLKTGSYVYNATKGKKERIGRILQMHANHREEIEEVYAGDIAAAVGLKETFTGDTLTDPDAPRHPRVDGLPRAGHRGRHRAQDQGRPGQARRGPAATGRGRPTFRVHTDESRGRPSSPAWASCTSTCSSTAWSASSRWPPTSASPRSPTARPSAAPPRATAASCARPVAGASTATPSSGWSRGEKGSGYEFVDKIVGGTIPREYIKSVDAGIREALETGAYAGFPMVDVKATLFDGSYHEVDSSEMAFKIAGSMAAKDAVEKADPAILEPIMRVEVTMPEEFMGDVIGDLNSRRGHIEGMDNRRGTQVVRAFVPLA